MPNSLSALPNYVIRESFYHLDITHQERELSMKMSLLTPSFTTSSYPQAIPILYKYLPSIFKTKCFNDLKQPFSVEVENTELAHLFEHIFLSYLYHARLALSDDSFTYSGVTSWNWKRDQKGLFHISVTGVENDRLLIPGALQKSIIVMNLILGEEGYQTKQTTYKLSVL